MLEVPPATPVAIPDDDPMVATPVLLLVHTPPPASVSVVEVPIQACAVPDIAEGNGLTVNVIALPVDRLEEQPAVFVNEVTVIVVLPEEARLDVVNVPVPEPMVMDVVPVPEFAPLMP